MEERKPLPLEQAQCAERIGPGGGLHALLRRQHARPLSALRRLRRIHLPLLLRLLPGPFSSRLMDSARHVISRRVTEVPTCCVLCSTWYCQNHVCFLGHSQNSKVLQMGGTKLYMWYLVSDQTREALVQNRRCDDVVPPQHLVGPAATACILPRRSSHSSSTGSSSSTGQGGLSEQALEPKSEHDSPPWAGGS